MISLVRRPDCQRATSRAVPAAPAVGTPSQTATWWACVSRSRALITASPIATREQKSNNTGSPRNSPENAVVAALAADRQSSNRGTQSPPAGATDSRMNSSRSKGNTTRNSAPRSRRASAARMSAPAANDPKPNPTFKRSKTSRRSADTRASSSAGNRPDSPGARIRWPQ